MANIGACMRAAGEIGCGGWGWTKQTIIATLRTPSANNSMRVHENVHTHSQQPIASQYY